MSVVRRLFEVTPCACTRQRNAAHAAPLCEKVARQRCESSRSRRARLRHCVLDSCFVRSGEARQRGHRLQARGQRLGFHEAIRGGLRQNLQAEGGCGRTAASRCASACPLAAGGALAACSPALCSPAAQALPAVELVRIGAPLVTDAPMETLALTQATCRWLEQVLLALQPRTKSAAGCCPQ